MARKRDPAEEIIGHLREAEVALAQGQPVGAVVRTLGISEPPYSRWRREDGGLRVDQAKRLKGLERENSRLKRLVADQALDNAMLRDVAAGNFCARPHSPNGLRYLLHQDSCWLGEVSSVDGHISRHLPSPLVGNSVWCPGVSVLVGDFRKGDERLA